MVPHSTPFPSPGGGSLATAGPGRRGERCGLESSGRWCPLHRDVERGRGARFDGGEGSLAGEGSGAGVSGTSVYRGGGGGCVSIARGWSLSRGGGVSVGGHRAGGWASRRAHTQTHGGEGGGPSTPVPAITHPPPLFFFSHPVAQEAHAQVREAPPGPPSSGPVPPRGGNGTPPPPCCPAGRDRSRVLSAALSRRLKRKRRKMRQRSK